MQTRPPFPADFVRLGMAAIIACIYGAQSEDTAARCMSVMLPRGCACLPPQPTAVPPSSSPCLAAALVFHGQGHLTNTEEDPATIGNIQNVMGLLFSSSIFVGAYVLVAAAGGGLPRGPRAVAATVLHALPDDTCWLQQGFPPDHASPPTKLLCRNV